jgi:putative drug exporter of the RND superfamily
MNLELLLIETDDDVRHSADMLVSERIAKAVCHALGIGRVTRAG